MFVICRKQSVLLPERATIKDLADFFNLKEPHQAVAATCNGTLSDLSTLKLAKNFFGIALLISLRRQF
jgi:hypothetical protein